MALFYIRPKMWYYVSLNDTTQNDKTIFACAQKLTNEVWRDGQLNLAHCTKTENKEKLKTKTE